ncbi:MAG: hypothetical protein MK142_03205 [Pseudomonadales bacterium]|nr:hypothetical protein [Pseudomonadales bacterium]
MKDSELWRSASRCLAALLGALLSLGPPAVNARPEAARSILFVGNSFTFGYGSAVRHWRADSVTDLNGDGVGGVPALFEAFTNQLGLSWDVYLETRGGADFAFHLQDKRPEITSRPFDVVVAHSFSTLDAANPGDPSALLSSGRELAALLLTRNPDVELYVTATWSRPDLVYGEGNPWAGRPIEAMGREVEAAYGRLAAEVPGVKAVNPVGEAFNRAMRAGIADSDPYDGIGPGMIDLWAWDHYHASTYGYYLEALVVFGNVTGLDPVALGPAECGGYELGMSAREVLALQQVARDALSAAGVALARVEGRVPGNRGLPCL